MARSRSSSGSGVGRLAHVTDADGTWRVKAFSNGCMGCLTPAPPGGLVATPFSVQDSSMLSRLAWADCLVLRAPLAPPARAGDEVEIIELGGGSQSI